MSAIKSGTIDVAVCGGTETMSDVPLRLSKPLRQKGLALNKAKSVAQAVQIFFKDFKPKHLSIEVPSIAEFSTKEVMGHSADRLASAFGVTRKEQVNLFFLIWFELKF